MSTINHYVCTVLVVAATIVAAKIIVPFALQPGGFTFEWLHIHPVKAITERLLAPLNVSGCMRCMRPWALQEQTVSMNGGPFKTEPATRGVESHTTNYSTYSGMFPLCKECWSALTPEERLPYYKRLYDSWGRSDLKWDTVKEAVLDEGKGVRRGEFRFKPFTVGPREMEVNQ